MATNPEPRRLVVGISGASAPIYGIRILQMLRPLRDIETHLVCTATVERTVALETEYTMEQVRGLADVVYSRTDMAAAISSGSFQTMGMIVAPCSINTLACIASSITKDLLARAADVTLKERRPLVLLVRESPLHLGHLRRLLEVTQMGAIVAPPIPSFYQRPKSAQDIVDHGAGRALDLFGLNLDEVTRWTSPE